MDGNPSTRKVVVSEHLGWPNALAIDYTLERIFWADAKWVVFSYFAVLFISYRWLYIFVEFPAFEEL